MKTKFAGYYPPTEDEFQQMWNECIFVFDANVLLSLYRYSPETSQQLIGILESVSERIWIPYQFADEYHRNLQQVKLTAQNEYVSKSREIVNKLQEAIKLLKELGNRTRTEFDQLFKQIERTSRKIEKQLKQEQEAHTTRLSDDDIENTVLDLFDDKVGEPYDQQRLEQIYKSGKIRYEKEIPPGFGDKKSESTRYNDLVGWLQIIDHAKSQKKPVILITDDHTKGDWYLRINGKTRGPLPALRQEMLSEAGVPCYLYPTPRFMEEAKTYLDSQVSDDAIEEVRATESSSNYNTFHAPIPVHLRWLRELDKQIPDLPNVGDKFIANHAGFDAIARMPQPNQELYEAMARAAIWQPSQTMLDAMVEAAEYLQPDTVRFASAVEAVFAAQLDAMVEAAEYLQPDTIRFASAVEAVFAAQAASVSQPDLTQLKAIAAQATSVSQPAFARIEAISQVLEANNMLQEARARMAQTFHPDFTPPSSLEHHISDSQQSEEDESE